MNDSYHFYDIFVEIGEIFSRRTTLHVKQTCMCKMVIKYAKWKLNLNATGVLEMMTEQETASVYLGQT